MEKFRKGLDFCENIIIDLCAILLIGIIAIIMYQIIGRAMDVSMSGTEELARYFYVLFVFLLWPVAAKRGQDLRITVFFDILSQRTRSIVMGIFNILMAGLSGLLVYSIFTNTKLSLKNGTVLPSNTWLPLWIIQTIVAVSLVLVLLANIMRAILLFTGEISIHTQQEDNEAEMAAETAKIQAELDADPSKDGKAPAEAGKKEGGDNK